MTIDSFAFTSPGGREHNEDAVDLEQFPDGGIYALGDGLGGHLHGEIASDCVVSTVVNTYDAQQPPRESLVDCLARANEEILTMQKSGRGAMKSTAVCLLLREDRAYWAHVGDSRLYYLHNGALETVTADHSVAYKKYQRGEITRSQIAGDEDQSALLRALGNPNRCQPDTGFALEPLESGDGFLLCSDGLWEYLHDQEILIDLLKTETAEQWAKQLLLRVMERVQPGNDNLSLIAVRII